jgi:hypothetical protein
VFYIVASACSPTCEFSNDGLLIADDWCGLFSVFLSKNFKFEILVLANKGTGFDHGQPIILGREGNRQFLKVYNIYNIYYGKKRGYDDRSVL